MAKSQTTTKTGETAVDGLLAGIGAGLAMALYLVLTGLFGGAGIPETLSRFAPFGDSSALAGLLSHLAVSAIYGTLCGVMFTTFRRRLPAWIAGVFYGLLLYLVARLVLLPGTDSPLSALSAFNFAAAHLVFGLVLGLLVGGKEKSIV
jgi:hypothetical protein